MAFLITLSPEAWTQSLDEKLDGFYEHPEWLISPRALMDSLEADKKVYLLDSRQRAEYRVSHIPGALRVDYEGFEPKQVSEVPQDALVVVYCTVGWRSERVTGRLREAGYERSYNLYGSILAWSNHGFALENKRGQSTQRVHTYSRSWSAYLEQGQPVYDWWKMW